jgi:hypothetical protein
MKVRIQNASKPIPENLTKGETLAKVALLCNQLNLRFFYHFLYQTSVNTDQKHPINRKWGDES